MAMEYTGRTFFKKAVTGKTQAGGAFTLDVSDSLFLGDAAKRQWQVQVETVGAVTAGTLTIGVKTPGASAAKSLPTTIDLASGPLLVEFDALAEALTFTPAGFDGTSFDVYAAAC